jgi:PRC-barrel domain
VGSAVVNDAKETVGTIDDLIVTSNEKVLFAMLSAGGFLSMGSKYVVVCPSAHSTCKTKRWNFPVLPKAR